MSLAASESRPFPVSVATVWPVLFLLAAGGCCWAVTVERMQGTDMGPGTDLGGLDWFVVAWLTMMAAMMLPSLSPMAVRLLARRGRRAGQVGRWDRLVQRRISPALGGVRRPCLRAG